jgi:hypothetical protein
VRAFALVELGDSEAIDLFLHEEDARGALEAMLLDEPDWSGQFYVQPVELDEQRVSANQPRAVNAGQDWSDRRRDGGARRARLRACCCSRRWRPSAYEEDHLIPLELGGAPRNPKNLWPEPRAQAAKSDPLETKLKRRVCRASIRLATARAAIRKYKNKNG